MNEPNQGLVECVPSASGPAEAASSDRGRWKPVATLLVLSPAVGELLSGSSPPLQFFNPVFFLLLVGLYGCGALLVREIVVARRLNVWGLLLLGAAYGILEEGLMCKSFFNPYWTDTGFLSVYGRAWGVNWVWAFGLTFYHMSISVAAPIFITQALFPARAREPWQGRRGHTIAGTALSLVVLLGFVVFDNRQFHYIELGHSLALAQRLESPTNALERFMAGQLAAKHRDLVHHAVLAQADSPELRHGLQEALNRLLPRADLYSADRFSGVSLSETLKQQCAKPPHGDKLVEFNRALLEAAFPGILPARPVYPYRPGWLLTSACVLAIVGLVVAALGRTRVYQPKIRLRRPWLTGIGFTLSFVLVGFVLPSLVEHGAHVPAALLCGAWCVLGLLLGTILSRIDGAPDRDWSRGLWALGAITPWVLFALVLGLIVGMIGSKSFLGMPFVSMFFGAGILALTLKWKRRRGGSVSSPGEVG